MISPKKYFPKFSDWFYKLLMGFLMKAKNKTKQKEDEETKMQPFESECVEAKTNVAQIWSIHMLLILLKILVNYTITLLFFIFKS